MEWALLVYVLSTSHLRVGNVFETHERCQLAAYAWKKHLPVDTLCLPVHRNGVLAKDRSSHKKTEATQLFAHGRVKKPVTETDVKAQGGPAIRELKGSPELGPRKSIVLIQT